MIKKINVLKSEIKQLRLLVNIQGEELKKLFSLIDYDFLTGVYNRHGFIKEADKFFNELKKIRKKNERRSVIFKNFSIIFIDLDNLKIINDKLGHKTGDQAIKVSARLFQSSVRTFDIVGRWGGDEFVIGLLGTNKTRAVNIAKELKKKLNNIEISGFKLKACFGVISMIASNHKHKANLSLHKLIEKADKAMYQAKKKKGKNMIISYDFH